MPENPECREFYARVKETFGPILAGMLGGGLTGLLALTIAAPMCQNVSHTYSQFPSLESPAIAVPFELPDWFAPLALAIASLGLLVIGPLLVKWLRPRDSWAILSVGMTAGLAATLTMYTVGLGWATVIGTTVVPSLADMTFITTPGMTPESIAERYPDLAAVKPEQRGPILMAKIVSDQVSGGAIGVWSGLLISLFVGGGLVLSGTLWAGYLRRAGLNAKQAIWPYLLLTIPSTFTFGLAVVSLIPPFCKLIPGVNEGPNTYTTIMMLGLVLSACIATIGVVRHHAIAIQVSAVICWVILLAKILRPDLPLGPTIGSIVLTAGLMTARIPSSSNPPREAQPTPA